MRSEATFEADRQATFLRLMEQYRPALWRLIHSYEADFSLAEDMFQEIALGLWKAIPRFRGDASERTWLYRIAHNIAATALYSRRRQERREFPIDGAAESPSAGEAPDRTIHLHERREAMLAAIRRLPAVDKQVIALHLEGLSYEEIEQVSGLTESAIATRLTRIRHHLSEQVRKEEVEK